MSRFISLAFLSLLLLAACGRYEYWELSKFNMQPDVLENNEQVQLIYSSNAPAGNKGTDYYLHLMVERLESRDTLNILTTFAPPIDQNDKKLHFYFVNEEHVYTKIARMALQNPESLKEVKSVGDIKPDEVRAKVLRDPKFDYLADNTFPTVIGSLSKEKVLLNME